MMPPEHLSTGARAYLLDPDVLEYPRDWTDAWSVQEFREVAHPVWNELNELIDVGYEIAADVIAGVVVERVTAGGPRDDAVLLHLHGGMYCVGTPEIDRVLNTAIAHATGAEVVSVDYRLAPEHPFPAALDDALAVLDALLASGRKVAIFGESAGGGLAAATALAARDRGLPTLTGLALLSPMLDLTGSSDTFRTLAEVDPDYSDTSILLEPAAAYASGTALDHPLLSPVFADPTGLPKTLIQVGGREVLLGDSTRFARTARQAGVDVTLSVADGCWHNFVLWKGVPEADQAMDELARFLQEALK